MKIDNFFSELKRRNVYKVAVAYAIVGWLVIQAASIVLPAFEAPSWILKVVIFILIIGFPVALIFAWAFELTPEGIRRSASGDTGRDDSRHRAWVWIPICALALSIALFVAGRYTARPAMSKTGTNDKSIAVLPFADLSPAKDQEYFCDGISEELLDALAKVEGLRVVARTSSFSFKGKNAPVAEIGSKLGVATVLEGSLRREGNRIRVTAQLVDAKDGFHLWSETFERELQSVFAVQDEITRRIVEALKLKLAVAPATTGGKNTAAYDLYLQGLYYSNKSTEEGLRKSLDYFQRSLDIDPNSARAWAGIAKDWTWLADEYVKPLDAYPMVRAAAAKAVALDDSDPAGHVYLAEASRVLDWDMSRAIAELNRALRLDPNSADAHLFLALCLGAVGDAGASTTHMRAALKADPLSPIISNFATLLFVSYGHLDEAVEQGKRTQDLDPNYLYGFPALAVAYHQKGMLPEAITLYKKAQEMTGQPQAGLAVAYAATGELAEARRIRDELKELSAKSYARGEDVALASVAIGDNDEALRWLERAVEEHSGSIHSIAVRPGFAPLYSDPRFAVILRRIGLDPTKVLARTNNPK